MWVEVGLVVDGSHPGEQWRRWSPGIIAGSQMSHMQNGESQPLWCTPLKRARGKLSVPRRIDTRIEVRLFMSCVWTHVIGSLPEGVPRSKLLCQSVTS